MGNKIAFMSGYVIGTLAKYVEWTSMIIWWLTNL